MNKLLQGNISIAAVLLCGCTQLASTSAADKSINLDDGSGVYIQSDTQGCDHAWFEKVEQQIITGDGEGHGPDIGSMEWRSVVEFKLGIRGNESNPSLNSDLWCDYIDKRYIDNRLVE
ncbi:hypothetical protein ACVBIL_05040 [Shewanella sp. 125m-7]